MYLKKDSACQGYRMLTSASMRSRSASLHVLSGEKSR
jgi:hypothetical protein